MMKRKIICLITSAVLCAFMYAGTAESQFGGRIQKPDWANGNGGFEMPDWTKDKLGKPDWTNGDFEIPSLPSEPTFSTGNMQMQMPENWGNFGQMDMDMQMLGLGNQPINTQDGLSNMEDWSNQFENFKNSFGGNADMEAQMEEFRQKMNEFSNGNNGNEGQTLPTQWAFGDIESLFGQMHGDVTKKNMFDSMPSMPVSMEGLQNSMKNLVGNAESKTFGSSGLENIHKIVSLDSFTRISDKADSLQSFGFDSEFTVGKKLDTVTPSDFFGMNQPSGSTERARDKIANLYSSQGGSVTHQAGDTGRGASSMLSDSERQFKYTMPNI